MKDSIELQKIKIMPVLCTNFERVYNYMKDSGIIELKMLKLFYMYATSPVSLVRLASACALTAEKVESILKMVYKLYIISEMEMNKEILFSVNEEVAI